jgi:hypothetical protein
MLSASDTAYPLLKASPSARELDEFFTPNLFELTFAEKHTRQPALLVGLLLLLKTFQRLGYSFKLQISRARSCYRSYRLPGSRRSPKDSLPTIPI